MVGPFDPTWAVAPRIASVGYGPQPTSGGHSEEVDDVEVVDEMGAMEVTVVVEVETVENIEVAVRSFTLPSRYPAPAPASIATTSRAAITSFLMPQRVTFGGV
jgi:hypothetical protein